MTRKEKRAHINNIECALNKEYPGENEEQEQARSDAFNFAIKCFLKKLFPKATVFPRVDAFGEASGHIAEDGKFLYYRFGGYLWCDWKTMVFVRASDGLTSKGYGHWYKTDVLNMDKEARRLFKAIKLQKTRRKA